MTGVHSLEESFDIRDRQSIHHGGSGVKFKVVNSDSPGSIVFGFNFVRVQFMFRSLYRSCPAFRRMSG